MQIRTHGCKAAFTSLVVVGSFVVLLALCSFNAAAVPASPTPIEVTQPDGTKLQLHLRGDEYFSWQETAEGYVVVKDADGFWKFARLVPGRAAFRAIPNARVGAADPAGLGLSKRARPDVGVLQEHLQKRREALHGKPTELPKGGHGGGTDEPPQPPQEVPVAGTVSVKNVVILACFSNHWDYANSTVLSTYGRVDTNEFLNLYNQIGHTNDGAKGSVKDYYLEVSYGKLTIDSVVSRWLLLPREESYYHDNQGTMAADAIAAAEAGGFDFSQADTDGDGWVDAIDIIHSGYGEEATGNSNHVWSVKGSLSTVVTNDGVKMKPYHTEPSLRDDTGTGITRIGVICHETGHFFGLPDLYDTSGISGGIGNWCIMAGGTWNNSGIQPAHFNAWCKVNLGFAKPVQIHSKTGVSLPRVEDNAVVGMIRDGTTNREYYLVENRAKTGFDNTSEIFPGLLVWHIYNVSPGNNPSSHPHPVVRLEEADGNGSLGFSKASSSQAGDVWTSTSALAGGFRDQTGNTNTSAMLYMANPSPYQTNLFYIRTDDASRYSYIALTNFSAAGSTMTFDATTLKPSAPTQYALPTNYAVAWRAASQATKYEIQEGTNATLTSFTDGAEDENATYESWYVGGKAKQVFTNASYAGASSYAMLSGDGSVHHLTMQKPFKVTTNTVITFRFLSHIATGNGYLKWQVSKDAGSTWATLGTTNGLVDGWPAKTNNYAALNAQGINAGDSCLLRFLVDIENVSGWSTYPAWGYALDDISITGVEIAGYNGWTTLNNNVTSNSYAITGKTNGVYAYRVQAYANGAWQGYGSEGETTVSTNHAPTFADNPVTGADAFIGSGYSASLTSLGTDVDSNDRLTYTKPGGPAWLTVSTNGTLSGTPLPTDLGTNTFTVRVTDLAGAYAEAQLVIFVNPPLTALNTNLVAYLPFDADFRDYSGRQNHPGLTNTNVRAAGYLGANAYVLTNSGYLSFGLASDLHFTNDTAGNSNSYSISFWAKIPPGSFSGAPPYIANKDWSSDTATGWALAAGPNSGGNGFFQMNFKESNANLREYDSANAALTNGNWHHYLVVHQRSGTRTCFTYIDGAQADSRTMFASGTGIDGAGLPLNLGQDGTGAGTRGVWTNALMDDFGFWRGAISADDVATIYRAGTNGVSLAYAQAAPIITNQPPTTNVALSGALSLPVGVLSGAQPAYQWRLNGTILTNATNATYTVASVALTNYGNYDVIVTNLYGSTTSQVANVSSPGNSPPVAGSITLGTIMNLAATLAADKVLKHCTDSDSNTLAITAVSAASAAGGTLAYNGTNITYTPPVNYVGADSFTYTLDDSHGGIVTGTVSVTVGNGQSFNLISAGLLMNGDAQLTYAGVPYEDYALDWAHSLATPITWLPLLTNSADDSGLLVFTNTPSGTNDFYRTRSVP